MTGKLIVLSCLLAFSCASRSLTAPAQSSDESERYAEEGQQALSAGNYPQAQIDFEKLAKLNPGIAEIHATLAVIDFKLRNYEQAINEIHTAQKLKPGLPKLDSLLGQSLAELGRYSESLPGLAKGFKQSSDKEIRRMCGLQLLRSYTGLGRDSDAVETALTLNKLYPDDPEVLYHTARIYGNFTYQVMEKLHDEAPGSIWMLQAQGEAAESQKDYETALAAFNHVLVLEPTRPGIHYRMGRVYLTRYHENHIEKDRDAAVEQFRVELTIDPQNGNAGYELAQIDNDLGRFEQAQHEFEDVVSHHPDFEQARVGLAGILLENGKEELAAQQLRRAVELDPNDDVAWYRLTRALRTGGSAEERQKAMTEFRKVHALVIAHTAPAKAPTPDQEVTPQTLGDTGQP